MATRRRTRPVNDNLIEGPLFAASKAIARIRETVEAPYYERITREGGGLSEDERLEITNLIYIMQDDLKAIDRQVEAMASGRDRGGARRRR